MKKGENGRFLKGLKYFSLCCLIFVKYSSMTENPPRNGMPVEQIFLDYLYLGLMSLGSTGFSKLRTCFYFSCPVRIKMSVAEFNHLLYNKKTYSPTYMTYIHSRNHSHWCRYFGVYVPLMTDA